MSRLSGMVVLLVLASCSAPEAPRAPRARLAPSAEAEGRDVVTARAPPVIASVLLLQRLARELHPADMVHGLDLVEAGGGPDDRPDRSSSKLCGPDADDEVRRRLTGYLGQAAAFAADGNVSILECHDLTCTKQPTMEWDPAVTIELARSANGKVSVRQIRSVDVLLRTDGVDADFAWSAAEGRRLAAKSCP